MKRPAFFFLLSAQAACNSLWSQAQEPVWLNHISNGTWNSGIDLTWDGQNGLFGIGTLGAASTLDDTIVSVIGSSDILIARWDTSGSLVWAHTAGGTCQPSDTDIGADIHYEEVNDQLIATGYFSCAATSFGSQVLNGTGPLSGIKNGFIAAYSPGGECTWARMITASPNLSLRPVMTDADGAIFIVGTGEISPITFHGSPQTIIPAGGFIGKYGPDGGLIHAERIIANGALRSAVWADPTEWYLSGSAKPGATLFGQGLTVSAVEGDGYVARVDTTGIVQWVTMLPSTGSADVYHAVVMPDGSCAVSGSFTGSVLLPDDTLVGPPSVFNSFVMVLNEQGAIQWAIPFSSSGIAVLTDLEVDAQGDILAYGRYEGDLQIGQTNILQSGTGSGVVCRLGSNGQLKGVLTFGRGLSAPGSLLATNHGFYLSSDFDSTLTLGSTVVEGTTFEFASDLFLARFDSLSGFTSVPSALIMEGGGLVIYANPNEGRCTIEMPQGIVPGSAMRLLVRDAQGNLLQEAPFMVSESGTVQLDIRAHAKGMYHVELIDERRRYTGKLVFQ